MFTPLQYSLSHTRSKILMSRPGRELERCKRRTPIARKSRGSHRICASDSELVRTSGTLQSGDYVRLRHRTPSRWREERGSRRSARAWSAATQSAESPLWKASSRRLGPIPSMRAKICSHPGVWAFSGEAWVSLSGYTVGVLTNCQYSHKALEESYFTPATARLSRTRTLFRR